MTLRALVSAARVAGFYPIAPALRYFRFGWRAALTNIKSEYIDGQNPAIQLAEIKQRARALHVTDKTSRPCETVPYSYCPLLLSLINELAYAACVYGTS